MFVRSTEQTGSKLAGQMVPPDDELPLEDELEDELEELLLEDELVLGLPLELLLEEEPLLELLLLLLGGSPLQAKRPPSSNKSVRDCQVLEVVDMLELLNESHFMCVHGKLLPRKNLCRSVKKHFLSTIAR
jgi:hypothetical protein